MAKSTVAVRFTGDTADLKRSLGDLDGKVGGLGSKMASFGKVAALGLAAVGVGAVAMGKSFVDAAVESQKVTKQTEAVIKSMGLGAKVTGKQIADLSTKLSLQTGIDDELIQSSSNVLLTFGNLAKSAGVAGGTFEKAQRAALDMSVALGQDLQSATNQIAKALNDPEFGAAALKKMGSLTQAEVDLAKAMAKSGDVAGAQTFILDALAAQYGGSAEAGATAGEKLSVVWGNLQEQLGEKLLPLVEKVSTWLATNLPLAITAMTPFLETAARWFGTVAEAVRTFVQDRLAELAAWWAKHGPAIVANLKDLADKFNDDVLPALTGFATFMKDEVLTRLADLATWVLENKPVLEALAVVVGTTLVVAFGAWATASVIAALASAAAWLVAIAPITAMVLLIGALTAATTFAIGTPAFGKLLQWAIDIAAAIWNFVEALGRAISQLGALISLARTAAGLIPDIPGIGPSRATINPVTGRPVPPRAHGGPVTGGSPYLVGEEGPELFVPGRSGTIVPNDSLGGRSGVVLNITNFVASDPVDLDLLLQRAALAGAFG